MADKPKNPTNDKQAEQAYHNPDAGKPKEKKSEAEIAWEKALENTQAHKRRKLINMAEREEALKPKVSIMPEVENLMADAKVIIQQELTQYLQKVKRRVSLNPQEARIVQGYLDTLVRIQKEEREQARAADLSNLSDEELADLAVKVLGKSVSKKLE